MSDIHRYCRLLFKHIGHLFKDFARLFITDCVITGYYLNITTNRKNRTVTKQNNATKKK